MVCLSRVILMYRQGPGPLGLKGLWQHEEAGLVLTFLYSFGVRQRQVEFGDIALCQPRGTASSVVDPGGGGGGVWLPQLWC